MTLDARKVEELFDALADLPPEDAARRLDADCAGDVALREAVARLLEHDRAAGAGFLAHPPTLVVEAMRAREPTASAPPREPERLGRFAVLRKLGEGGMGAVYMGHDALLDRRVALKLLHRDTDAREWLLREAQALARLAHPNVVAVHEVSEHEGRVFVAMELVEGQSLREWLAAGQRTVPRVLAMLVQAGKGLAAAHEAGLVHRDFKPDNVLVGRDGRARVVDFGIAALASRPEEQPLPGTLPNALASPLTHRGTLMGTPTYMAPEQFLGERATPASDQFSFCVTLYTAVYGQPPFAGEELAALSRSVLAGRLQPAPARPGTPAWLAPLLRRGLSREPSERFPSMAALITALEEHLARLPSLDPEVARRDRLRITGVSILLTLGIGTAVIARLDRRFQPSHLELLVLPVVMIAVSTIVNVVLREQITRLVLGRRFTQLFLIIGPALLAHRLLGLRFGTPVLHILAGDQLLLAAIFGVAALALDRALAAFSVIALAGACVDAYEPRWAGAVFAATCLLAMPLVILRWAHREPA
ncbi:serine/threonine-protein kinase [Archangium gephyra]|uniref:Serine/threonine kinase PKN8 n=1 Tax=Archangium gephyra TaxID=48 RepID=A0AAC8Q074_9BACT|nr:serine/threonine-protein kinase [Archangium gephyra]AKI98446.1 Serine/threonine kinase PKN8 [Archangium gephyra]REG20454.1 serine/threonine-protein kinase [Archangium gephyra]